MQDTWRPDTHVIHAPAAGDFKATHIRQKRMRFLHTQNTHTSDTLSTHARTDWTRTLDTHTMHAHTGKNVFQSYITQNESSQCLLLQYIYNTCKISISGIANVLNRYDLFIHNWLFVIEINKPFNLLDFFSLLSVKTATEDCAGTCWKGLLEVRLPNGVYWK